MCAPHQDWPLQVRTKERVVHHQRQVSLICNVGHIGDVGDDHRRVGRCLDVEHLRVRTNPRPHGLRIRRVYEAELQSKLRKQLRSKTIDAAVDRLRNDGVIARTQEAKHGVDRGHSRGENVGRLPAFQTRHAALQRLAVRVVGARVVVALVLAQRLVHVGRGLIDRRDDGAGGRVRLLPDVNRIRGKSHSVSSKYLSSFAAQCNTQFHTICAARSRIPPLCVELRARLPAR